ncbi:MAG TPA: TIGR03086 family metal-binding protein [Verrucomicrobiae bacterium]|nr:TIGR03086 family metal-binding protein [Verrucomicrobiae bacterium]
MTPSTSKTTDLLLAVLSDLARVIDGIAPAQLPSRTPCTQWDVEQLRAHVLGWLTTFAAGFADPGGRAPAADIDGYRPPPDPAGAVTQAAALMARALGEGAALRPLWLGENAMPGELALGMILWEYVVHGWDLARATGQLWAPPEAASQESLAFAPAMLTPDFQGDGRAFGPPVAVPSDAPPLERLLGLSGRDPGWSAG